MTSRNYLFPHPNGGGNVVGTKNTVSIRNRDTNIDGWSSVGICVVDPYRLMHIGNIFGVQLNDYIYADLNFQLYFDVCESSWLVFRI